MRCATVLAGGLMLLLTAPMAAGADWIPGPGTGEAAAAMSTVYNSFGPGHGGWDWMYNSGWAIRGEGFSGPGLYGVEQAFAFVSPTSGPATDVWIGLFANPTLPEPDEVTIRLACNPAGYPPTPADVMEEWTLDTFPSWDAWSPPRHLVGSGASVLQEGHSYWLWATAGETTECGWGLNGGDSYNPQLLLPHTLRREGQNWLPIANETVSAFRVDVLPEPSTLVLLGGGAISQLARARRRRKRAA